MDEALLLRFKSDDTINSKVKPIIIITIIILTLSALEEKNIVFTIINIITINLKATKINKFLQIKRPFPQLQKLIPVIIIDYYFKFLSQGFSASYVIIDESEGRDYEYIDKTIPS